MARIWTILLLILTSASLVDCYGGPLKYFRSSPYTNFELVSSNLERNHNIMLQFLSLFKAIQFGAQHFNLTLTKDSLLGLWSLFLKTFFYCKSWSCITLVDVMVGGFDEFRHFAVGVITERYLGYDYLSWHYFKKEWNVIKKITHDRGKQAFVDKSKCIRERIARYYMPMFEGNDTSSCTEFDDIIVSFSDQPFEDRSSLYYFVCKVVLLMILVGISFIVSKLIRAEWRTYLKQEAIFGQMDQLRITNRSHHRGRENFLDFKDVLAEAQGNEIIIDMVASDLSSKT
ncbi:unnamed protein product [Moneuplotes crassus]|uniref:Uncharacterized protein n=1 Tax=Euplotes crassus TaxID=5936 RepID=A0AAD1XR49_EUPCR|nr:unnamed protein product [Moneuplotes crassus]